MGHDGSRNQIVTVTNLFDRILLFAKNYNLLQWKLKKDIKQINMHESKFLYTILISTKCLIKISAWFALFWNAIIETINVWLLTKQDMYNQSIIGF